MGEKQSRGVVNCFEFERGLPWLGIAQQYQFGGWYWHISAASLAKFTWRKKPGVQCAVCSVQQEKRPVSEAGDWRERERGIPDSHLGMLAWPADN